MTHIKITKGLNIPIKGEPSGEVKALHDHERLLSLESPKQIAFDFTHFSDIAFKILVQVGDKVDIGQALAEDKGMPGRLFVSPAGGVVSNIQRGLKRRLEAIVIDVDKEEKFYQFEKIDVEKAKLEEIVESLKRGGIFTKILKRPFNLLANPNELPKSIFVKAIESAPFIPSAEMQITGHEKHFQDGLIALSKISKVHLVYSVKTQFSAFLQATHVEKHTAEGPHPIGTSSVHIQKIDPIQKIEDIVWTINAHDVAAIGILLAEGRIMTEKVISIAGPGVIEGRSGFFKVREGVSVNRLIEGRIPKGYYRLVSGDPLTGHRVTQDGFLGFNDYAFSVIPENESREFLHFFRVGKDKYSMSRAYLSGHLNNADRSYDFDTSLHGEPRPFIVASLYDQVQPLDISTMLLVKAVMAEDFELAESLGLLEVAPEDFALPTFVCPSKIEMTDIISSGLKAYAKEVLE